MKRTWLIVLPLFVTAGCSSGATKSTETTTLATSAISPGETTTSIFGSVTTVATTATTATTATIAPPTTTAVAGVLTPARNIPTGWVGGLQEGDPRVFAAAGDCQPFYDAMGSGPYSQSRCGVWSANDGLRTWTVTRGVSGFLIAIIWQQLAANDWVSVLRSVETTAGQWDDITIVTGNTDSGPADELISGTRIAGASGKLAMAVIDIRSGGPRVVAVHPTGNHGVAVLRPGAGIEIWSAVEGDAIPKCCPMEFTQSFLVVIEGSWFVDTRGIVPTGDPAIPESEF